MLQALSIILGYLLGSIPTAYIIGRLARGIDIRKVGGGNMGALNTARELGRGYGSLVLVVDIAKGAGAVLIAKALGVAQFWIFLAGFAAIVGHCWPVFLKFRGGKGAATTIGVFLSLAPVAFACTLPFLGLVILFTSNVTLGIAVSMLLFPFSLWLWGHSPTDIIGCILIALFLGLRYFPTAKKGLEKAGNARDFIVDKNYKPWQARKNNPRK